MNYNGREQRSRPWTKKCSGAPNKGRVYRARGRIRRKNGSGSNGVQISGAQTSAAAPPA